MTPQEAIGRIKNHNEVHSRKERHFAVHITEALNMAVEALEKQIPKKPSETDNARCIHCACVVKRDERFCKNCGQALDWSDIE